MNPGNRILSPPGTGDGMSQNVSTLRNNWQCLYVYVLSFGQMKCRHVHVQSLCLFSFFKSSLLIVV